MLYRAVKDIVLGSPRGTIKQGTVVEYAGDKVFVYGEWVHIPTIDLILDKKWLIPTQQELVVARAPAPAEPVPEAPPEQERIPYNSPETATRNGKAPKADAQHVWDTRPTAFLNNTDGPVCVICGVTKLTGVIRADRLRGDGSQQHQYRDAMGNLITTLEELSCPTYLGDPGSAAATAKDQVRKVRGRVDHVEGRLETVDERLERLEEDNEFLRNRLLNQPVLDAEMVADALTIIAQRTQGLPVLEEKVRALLAPILDVDDLVILDKVPVVALKQSS